MKGYEGICAACVLPKCNYAAKECRFRQRTRKLRLMRQRDRAKAESLKAHRREAKEKVHQDAKRAILEILLSL